MRLKNIVFKTIQVIFEWFQAILQLGFSILIYSWKFAENFMKTI